jgi:hypothetical protein
MPAGTGAAAEASSGGGYAVAVASERSAADADAVFRSLQAKFPNQLGGREPIVRRTDLGPEGIYYRASIGPFVSMKAAARVCSSLRAAGGELSRREKLRGVRRFGLHGRPRLRRRRACPATHNCVSSSLWGRR